MLAGAAFAALIVAAAPAAAVSPLQTPSSASFASNSPIASFYAARRGAPFWLRSGAYSPEAQQLLALLRRAPLDGLASGPALAEQAQALMTRASLGDAAALAQADQLLSNAWVLYVEALETPPPG